MRFKAEEEEAPSEDAGVTSTAGESSTRATFSTGQLGGLSGTFNTAEEGEPPLDRQPSVVDTLKSGTRRASMAAGALLKSLQVGKMKNILLIVLRGVRFAIELLVFSSCVHRDDHIFNPHMLSHGR